MYEVKGDTEDLVRIASVKAPGRPEAVEAAIKASPSLKERLDAGEELALLPLAKRLLVPLQVKLEVRRDLRVG